MSKLNGEQISSNEYASNSINTNSVGSMSSNSMSTTFPSNHHLLVRHAAVEIVAPSIQYQLNSGNSFEMNGVTSLSLSEDSGLPLTTNSSISSGDSTRMGICKFEFELATESDAEVSQFDSLDNCSDGGMSTETFNTLKKVPLAPIDPPPEFQDSPQTTLLRSTALQSFSTKLANNIVSNAMTVMNTNTIYDEVPTLTIKTKSLEMLPTENGRDIYSQSYYKRNVINDNDNNNQVYHLYNRTDDYHHYHAYDIYASDSILNAHIDNIYDVPCDEYGTNVSCDSFIAIQNGDHFTIFDDNNSMNALKRAKKIAITKPKCHSNQSQMERANEIHDYDVYYERKKNETRQHCTNEMPTEPYLSATSTLASSTIDSMVPSLSNTITSQFQTKTTSDHEAASWSLSPKTSKNIKKKLTSSSSATSTAVTTFQHRKTPSSILYSPLHYHANSSLSTGNRPNSRNSLNSRLSSSHNSLTISSSNKADDSIFITQAMSHDALTSREISDFYNVPIDSDIYALPIDVIRPISSVNNNNNRYVNSKKVAAPHGDKTTVKSTVSMQNTINNNNNNNLPQLTSVSGGGSASVLLKNSTKRFRGRLKYVRNNKKRKRQSQSYTGDCNGIQSKASRSNNGSSVATNESVDKRHSVPDNVIVEPMHMTLDEVKRLYTSLYSSSSESALELTAITKNMSNQFNNNSNNNSTPNSGRINKLTLSSASCVFSAFGNKTNNINNDNSMAIKSDRNSNLSHLFNLNMNNNNSTISLITTSNTKTSIASQVSSATTPSNNNNNNNNALTNCTNSKLPNTKIVAKNGCSIKKISSSPSIAKENSNATAQTTTKKSQFSISLNLKQKFYSIFRFRKSFSSHHHHHSTNGSGATNQRSINSDYDPNNSDADKKVKFSTRALPPLPPPKRGAVVNEPQPAEESNNVIIDANYDEHHTSKNEKQNPMDFAANIEKVKEYGWYWGPISSEAAEKLLKNEPDGSFIVRDSSDDHYIFSLTFKLNNSVRHVRIEQDQGTFSFGSCAKFKSRTIMEFIENAVESSRSGRYLFFFHRRPEHGPMRVQLTNPVSRFKHIQSLQHMCRFVIRRAVVRKDYLNSLPLPRRLLDYLSYKNCYSEQIESDSSQSPPPSQETETAINNDDTEEHVIMR